MRVRVMNGQVFLGGGQVELGAMLFAGAGSVKFFKAGYDLFVTRYTKSEREAYTACLGKEGQWEIGADSAFRVFDPNSTADQAAKLLRQLGQNGTPVSEHEPGQPLTISACTANVWCNVRGRTSSRLASDETVTVVEGDTVRGSGYWYYTPWTGTLSTATWAVVYGHRSDSRGWVDPAIFEVHIWGNPGFGPIEKLILEHMRGKGANRLMLVAEKAGLLLDWLRPQVGPGSTTWHVRLGAEEFPLFGQVEALGDSQYPEKHHAVARAFNNLSLEDRVAVLPEPQRGYAKALTEKESAFAWLRTQVEFFRLNDKLYIVGEGRYLYQVEKGRYVSYGPLAVLCRHWLYDEVLVAAPKLGEPMPVEHVQVRCWSETQQKHLAAAKLSVSDSFEGAAQSGNLRFVATKAWGRPGLALGVCTASDPSAQEVSSSTEGIQPFVWLDSEEWGGDHTLREPAGFGGSRLQIWRVR